MALLRSELESCDDVVACKLTGEEQLDRINALVDYQLQRAATEGKSNLLAPVSIGEIINKLMNSLKKVYQSKNIHTQCEIERDAMLHADEGDMYELLGNLLENAFKYCDKRVNIVLRQQNRKIIVRIEDDGPGVPAHASADIIKRGLLGCRLEFFQADNISIFLHHLHPPGVNSSLITCRLSIGMGLMAETT